MGIKPVKVSQLNGYIKRILQSDPLLGNVSVIGEISNLKYHSTGNIYFTLKDESSKVSCFLSFENLKNIHYELADGMEITVNGYISLYERGGSYSLNIKDITIEGIGNLYAAFEKLREKLEKEGLFQEKYKKSIPTFPNKIAIITSETGAAIQDIIKIIKSRNNIVDVIIYPCLVQGPEAASKIAMAIDEVNRLFSDVDTIIIGRGGGSIEELWAFNEEIVARSIFASTIPIISAVGHETDFTIADFVADKRAETPTAAAQIAIPDINALKDYVQNEMENLKHNMERFFRYMDLRVKNNSIESLFLILKNRLNFDSIKADNFYRDISNSICQRIIKYESQIGKLNVELEALNPRNIMERGYAAILDCNRTFVNSVDKFTDGNSLTAVLKDGTIKCEIKEIRRE